MLHPGDNESQDRIRDGISLDQLSRVLVDVQSDSSVVVDTIVTKHQLDLQKLIFRDDEENRSKVSDCVCVCECMSDCVCVNMGARE